MGFIAMHEQRTLEKVGENLALLIQEAAITGRLLFESIPGLMAGIKPGRTLKTPGWRENLFETEKTAAALKEILADIHSELQTFSRLVSPSEALAKESPNLVKEFEFWETFQKLQNNFLNRLRLMAEEGPFTDLGKSALEEAWKQIEEMVHSSVDFNSASTRSKKDSG